MKLLSPLPAWLKPGRAHVLMTVESVQENPKRQKLTASPEVIARRSAALEEIRKLVIRRLAYHRLSVTPMTVQ